MNDEKDPNEPALTPLGTLPEPPVRSREGNTIHTAPEFAVGEGDVRSTDSTEEMAGGACSGTSLPCLE